MKGLKPTSGTPNFWDLHLRDGPPKHLALKTNKGHIPETHKATPMWGTALKWLMPRLSHPRAHRFIHVVTYISTSFHFITLHHMDIPLLFIHLPVDQHWVVSTFLTVMTMLLWIFLYKILHEHISILLSICLNVKFWGYTVTLRFLRKCQAVFQSLQQ